MPKTIYKKLLDIQKAVLGLAKDAQGNAAPYVSGNKILGVVRPRMDEAGLLLTKDILEYSFTPIEYSTSKGAKKEMFCAIKIRFTWIDCESGETLPIDWASSGCNGFDKSLGSALTYGERYFLLKQFGVQTDKDDVDAVKSPEQEMNDMNWETYFNSLGSVKELDEAWAKYGEQLKGNKAVIKAFNLRKKALMNGTQN